MAVIFCFFPVGCYFSTLPGAAYWANPSVPHYFLKDLTLITGTANLAGVFVTNPVRGSVNASLWTLQYELIPYLITGLLGYWPSYRTKDDLLLGWALPALCFFQNRRRSESGRVLQREWSPGRSR